MSDNTIENLARNLPLDKTLDFIQFRTTYLNNFDFEKARDLAKTS